MSQTPILKAFKYVLLGGISFWAPDDALHWLRGNRFSGQDALALTVLLPIITALVLLIDWKLWPKTETRRQEALLALLGIWLLGPLMMALGSAFFEKGFSQINWHFVVMGTYLFPIYTFEMSTYDGALMALLFASVLLPFLPKLAFRLANATLKN